MRWKAQHSIDVEQSAWNIRDYFLLWEWLVEERNTLIVIVGDVIKACFFSVEFSRNKLAKKNVKTK